MKRPIGFVLLTHSNPDQVASLCARLTSHFESPPIVIHHDFNQAPIDEGKFPENVSFVRDWMRTTWGGYGVVGGALRAIRDLYRKADPDWFVVLSGADYPIKPARLILEELYSQKYDAYLDHRKIQHCMLAMPTNGWGADNFVASAWVRLAFERYMAIGFGFYKLATRLKWKRKAFYLRSNFFIKQFTPFDGTLDCFAGDFWFTANRASAEVLLADTAQNRRLVAHFQRRPNPDEGFFQTVLCNAPGLRICTDNKRYADWIGCVNHPRTLTREDLPALVASTDHFARKFTLDVDLFDQLDRLVYANEGKPFDTTASQIPDEVIKDKQFR